MEERGRGRRDRRREREEEIDRREMRHRGGEMTQRERRGR